MTPNLTILKGHQSFKTSVFESLASHAKSAGGSVEQISHIGMRRAGFPETEARTETALARAKRQPKGLVRFAKRRLIAAQYNWSRAHFAEAGGIAVCWNGLTGSRKAYMDGAQDAGAGRLFVELAPFQGFVSMDRAGLNAEASVPRAKAALGAMPLSDARMAELAGALVARAARSGRVGQETAALPDEPFLFCPLQVPNDSQIQVFGGWVQSVEGFIGALAQAATQLPEGWHLRVKEHPSSRVSMAGPLEAARAVTGGRLRVDNATDTFEQVRASRGVITVNSSLALQSFLLDRAVVTTGQAFFAEKGLVHPAGSQSALNALCAEPTELGYDATHRRLLLGYLLDDYLVPFDGTDLDADRCLAKLSDAARSA